MEQPSMILVVEDEQPIRDLLIQILSDAGYAVLAAEDAEQALQVSRDYAAPIHLLLTDIFLPGQMNGLALARQLAELRPGLKILYTSGYPLQDEVFYSDILQPGRGFLEKPFTVTLCLEMISEL